MTTAPRVRVALAWATAVMLLPAHPLRAESPAEVASGQSHPPYMDLATRHRDRPELQAFQDRLRLIDEVRKDLEAAFEQRRVEALDHLLDDVMDLPDVTAREVVQRDADAPVREDAVSLLRRYGHRFAEPLPASGFSADERAAVREQYNLAIGRAGDFIADKGRSVAAAKPEEAMHAMALSLVLPLLHTPDEAWADADVERLPAWVREALNLRELEDFALRVHRPLTAYVFAEHARRLDAGAAEASDVKTYLESTADRLLRSDRFDEALAALRAHLGVAEGASDADTVTASRFRIAQVLDDLGRSEEAAVEIARVLEAPEVEPNNWGKAAMLRLKYLYGAGQHDAVIEESERYHGDDRAADYLPQVLYVTWVSARQGDRPQAAEQAKKLFVSKFPDHVLGADVYFAEAMESLARSDYDEAARVLEYIRYRYPQSRLIKRVEEIEKRLAQGPASASAEQRPAVKAD